jgi:hypothetical protein
MIRKEMTVQRATLIGMALGLFMIVQPWSPLLFGAGFPFTLAAIIGYNVSGWMSGERAGKFRDDEKKRAEAGR